MLNMWTTGERLDDSEQVRVWQERRSPLPFILLFRFLDGLSHALSLLIFFFNFFFRLDSVLWSRRIQRWLQNCSVFTQKIKDLILWSSLVVVVMTGTLTKSDSVPSSSPSSSPDSSESCSSPISILNTKQSSSPAVNTWLIETAIYSNTLESHNNTRMGKLFPILCLRNVYLRNTVAAWLLSKDWKASFTLIKTVYTTILS